VWGLSEKRKERNWLDADRERLLIVFRKKNVKKGHPRKEDAGRVRRWPSLQKGKRLAEGNPERLTTSRKMSERGTWEEKWKEDNHN